MANTDEWSCANNLSNGYQDDGFSLSNALRFADKLLIHGGNIANWNRTKRKTTSNSSDELCESITTTLNNCLPVTVNNNNLQVHEHNKTVRSVNSCFVERIDKEERVHLKISVKVFAIDLRPSLIKDALFRAMCELGVDSIESLILTCALPDQKTPEYFEGFKQLWEEMEEVYDSGYVKTLGTCDLDKETLEKLYNWARIKPEINQVNLASCCVMPKDLVEYSKLYDIQLLTHADPQEMLTEDHLQQIVSGITEDENVEGWKPVWVLRYSVLVKCRGVIKNKAYIVKCERH